MNIFWLDLDPEQSARWSCDQHITKMITEYTQMLVTALHELGFKRMPMRPTHSNHPCALWARSRFANFAYLAILTGEYNAEYQRRYGPKEHRGFTKLGQAIKRAGDWEAIRDAFADPTSEVSAQQLRSSPEDYLTVPPQCMPEQFTRALRGSTKHQLKTVVSAYRDLYANDKIRFARWRFTELPPFIKSF